MARLNPHPNYVPYRTHLTPQEAPDIFAPYDLVLDCTDNPATRYLISDTVVLLQKVLVSASALRTDGQLMILNYPARPAGDQTGGPCYRCMFPKPPPTNSVVSCADGGILGPVVGLMGVMQALEAIKVITSPLPSNQSDNETSATPPTNSTVKPSLHLFSAYSASAFRSIRLRPRRANCAACSAKATITVDSLRSGSTDYVQFCGSLNPTSLLSPEERISVTDFVAHFNPSTLPPLPVSDRECNTILLDVREKIQYEICPLKNSINIPMSTILSSPAPTIARSYNGEDEHNPQSMSQPRFLDDILSSPQTTPIHVVCRLGNDSQVVVKKLKEFGLDQGGKRYIGDIKGGLRAWREEVDSSLPDY